MGTFSINNFRIKENGSIMPQQSVNLLHQIFYVHVNIAIELADQAVVLIFFFSNMTNDFCKHIIMSTFGVNLYYRYFPVFLLADSTVPVVFGLCVAADGAVPLRIRFL